MNVRRVNPAELSRPSGFTHGVVADGRWLALSGQTALDENGRIVGETIVEQFGKALANLLVVLSAVGASPNGLVSATIFVVDMSEYRRRAREIGEVWHTQVGVEYPAMACVEVSRLWDDEALIEIQGFAVVPSDARLELGRMQP